MNTRLITAIISTLLEEAAIVVVVLWGLPRLGIHIPLAGLISLMVAWCAWSIFTYRLGSRALRIKPVLPTMIGSKGTVSSPLVPQGLVRIGSELWIATSTAGKIDIGEKVTVVEQDGLKLVVDKDSASDLKEKSI
jgi:membrane protein implicated in regulation of membrane protease activity